MTVQIGKPNREQIEQRAYEIYLERGAQEGQDLADWLAAEKELTMMTQSADAPAAAPASATRSKKREAAA